MREELEEIKKAKSLLEKEGFKVIKLSKRMEKDIEECVEMDSRGESKECFSCHCGICIMQEGY